MPANVVHSPEQERLWNKAKARAEKQGRANDWRYIMGIFKQMGGLEKSFVIPAAFRLQRMPGQVPSKERLEALRLERSLEEKPKQPELAEMMRNDNPRGSASSAVDDLGMDARARSGWKSFLEKAVAAAPNELVLRQSVVAQTREAKMEPELRQAILDRALSYWRTVRKSLVEVVTVDELKKSGPSAFADLQKSLPASQSSTVTVRCSKAGAETLAGLISKVKRLGNPGHSYEILLDPDAGKEGDRHGWDGDGSDAIFEIQVDGQPFQKAEPRGGSYHRRVPQEDGGFRYYYDPEKYQSRADAHVDGREARKNYLHGRIAKVVGAKGKAGMHVRQVLDDFSEQFDPKEVEEAVKALAGGKLEFRKGRLYLRAEAGDQIQKSLQPKFIVRR